MIMNLANAWQAQISNAPKVILIIFHHFSEITRAILQEMLQKVSTCSQLLRLKNILLLLLKQGRSFTLKLFQSYAVFLYLYMYIYCIYLVNKSLQASGMSVDYVRSWEIVQKMNIWPRSEALRANVKFWGQFLNQGHYQLTYQQARKGFIHFLTLRLISYLVKRACKKSWSDGECVQLT